MKPKKGLLFLNGTPPSERTLASADFSLPVYCADGAYGYLSKYRAPDVLVGDFDSLDRSGASLPATTEILAYGAEKDFTDGFLAVKTMITRGFGQIDVFGALGGRPDHEQSNYLLLALARENGVDARFLCEDFQVLLCGETRVFRQKIGAIVSLVPYTDEVHILYTKGLKYPINDLVSSKVKNLSDEHYIMGVSNVAVAETVEIAVDGGQALVYLEK